MEERESHLLAEIEEQKQKMKDIQFMTKLAPLVASYTAANNLSLNQQVDILSLKHITMI